MDFDSRTDEIAARVALPAITQNGVSEEWRELLRNILVASDQGKELTNDILINTLRTGEADLRF